ncbi:MAG: hypothetical protein ACTS22_08485 [Phycisphaerales bacterium]
MGKGATHALGQITDGASAWAEFFEGVTAAFDANESALPMIGLVLAGIVVMAINIRVSVWLARRWSRRGSERPAGEIRQRMRSRGDRAA